MAGLPDLPRPGVVPPGAANALQAAGSGKFDAANVLPAASGRLDRFGASPAAPRPPILATLT